MNKIITWVVVLAVIGAGIWYWAGHKGNDDQGGALQAGQQEAKYTDPKDGEVAVVGTWECLPLASGEEVTKENCLLGVKGDDGKFYALDTSKVEIIGKDVDKASKVRIVGTSSSGSSSDLSGVFKYEAIVAVRVLQAAE